MLGLIIQDVQESLKFVCRNKIIVFLFFLGFCTLLFGLAWPLSQDEGVFLTISSRISQGELPYLDYFDHKPPGIYYLLAVMYKLFGTSFWASRLLMIVINVTTAVLLYIIGEKFLPKKVGAIAAIFYLFMVPLFEGLYIISEPFLALFLCAGLLCYFFGIQNNKSYYFALTGIFITLATAFKQPAIVILLAIISFSLLSKAVFKNKIRTILIFLLGTMFIFIPLAIWLQIHGLWSEFYHQVISVNLTDYPKSSFRDIYNRMIYLMLLTLPVWILSLKEILALILGPKFYRNQLFLVLLFVLLPLPAVLHRGYSHYWLQILPFICILAAAAFVKTNQKYSIALTLPFIITSAVYFSWHSYSKEFPKLKEQNQMYEKMALNDQFFYADRTQVGLYYLTNKKPLNRFFYLNETTKTQKAGEITVADIAKQKPYYIFWNSSSDNQNYESQRVIWEILKKDYRLDIIYPKSKIELYRITER